MTSPTPLTSNRETPLSNINIQKQRAAANALAESLTISSSLYQQAIERYESISGHLERNGGAVAHLAPRIYSQGSFQLGTVVRPIDKDEGYDLDLACELQTPSKTDQSQQELKDLIGEEVKTYAKQHRMQEPEEKPRCWHLDYRDEVTFHLDIVPALPEDESTKQQLRARVDAELVGFVDTAIAITDTGDDNYSKRTSNFPKSNPMGYADWFRTQAARRYKDPIELRKAEQIPSYEWNTPLQTVVQILKRHRDMMFEKDSEDAPISIIITTLAAQAYECEADLRDALVGIVNRLPSFADGHTPRIENPVNPDENFADKWAPGQKPERMQGYERWREKVQEDVAELGQYLTKDEAGEHFNGAFGTSLKSDAAARIVPVTTVTATPVSKLRHEPKPWTRLA